MSDVTTPDAPTEVPEDFRESRWFEGFGVLVGPIYSTKAGILPPRRAFRVSDKHVNGRGDCHGGMLMGFADMAFGHIISVQEQRYWATVRLMTDFVKAGKLGDWIEGGGEIVGVEDDFFTVRGRIWTGDQTLMTGSGVFKALGKRPASDIR